MPQKKYNLITLLILIAIVVYLVIFGNFLYKRELARNPQIDSLNLKTAKDFYTLANPNIDSVPYYGDSVAQVTIISYFDTSSEDTKFFIREIFPQIREEFINNGKLKYYQKPYLTEDDVSKKTQNYIYAKTMYCVSKLDSEHYYDIYFDIIMSGKDIKYYAERYNISVEALTDCITNQEFAGLAEELAEMQKFGIVGIQQRFYIGIKGADNQIHDGIPSYTLIRRTIRQKLFQIGESA